MFVLKFMYLISLYFGVYVLEFFFCVDTVVNGRVDRIFCNGGIS